MALGEALGGIIGGILGNNAAKSDRSNAKDAMKQAAAIYDQIGLPPDVSKELILKEFQRVGMYTPELEQDLNDTFAESEVGKIQEDPSLRKAQVEALSSMQNRAKVGLSAEDRAALNQVRNEVQRDAEAKRQQVLQQMQSRGMGGSGASLVAQLQAGQDAQNLASQQSDTQMAQAQSRALEALKSSSDMASQARGQDFSVNQAKANAIDERNRFLAENSISRQQRNVSNLNSAQLANLQEQQRIADANAQLANAEKQRQAGAQSDQYNQKLGWASGKSGQLTQLGNYLGDLGNQKAQAQVAMGKGAGGLVDAGVGAAFGAPAAGAGSSGWGAMAGKLMGSAAGGGIVGDEKTTGATAGPDDVAMNLREGEMVLNADQQAALFDFINRISKKFPKE